MVLGVTLELCCASTMRAVQSKFTGLTSAIKNGGLQVDVKLSMLQVGDLVKVLPMIYQGNKCGLVYSTLSGDDMYYDILLATGSIVFLHRKELELISESR